MGRRQYHALAVNPTRWNKRPVSSVYGDLTVATETKWDNKATTAHAELSGLADKSGSVN